MNKLTFILLLISVIGVTGCQEDDVKNTYTISGKIGSAEITQLIDGLSITLLSGDQIIATTNSSQYLFTNLEEGKSYTILPQVSTGDKNGLSTLDWVLIDKFIQGTEDFDVFQKIAADVNINGIISAEDMDLIRTCIIGGECFSYRFASEDYDGIGAGYLDQYVIDHLISDQVVNFVPIKLGDVNGTINP